MSTLSTTIDDELAYAEKSNIIGYVLWFVLGGFGAHRFYFGRIKTGILMVVLSLAGFVGVTVGGLMAYASGVEVGAEPSMGSVTVVGLGGLMLAACVIMWVVDAFLMPRWRRRHAEALRAGLR